MGCKRGTQKDKKVYEKPKLRTIELRADEVLTEGCKTSASGAFGIAPCNANNCQGLGS